MIKSPSIWPLNPHDLSWWNRWWKRCILHGVRRYGPGRTSRSVMPVLSRAASRVARKAVRTANFRDDESVGCWIEWSFYGLIMVDVEWILMDFHSCSWMFNDCRGFWCSSVDVQQTQLVLVNMWFLMQESLFLPINLDLNNQHADWMKHYGFWRIYR